MTKWSPFEKEMDMNRNQKQKPLQIVILERARQILNVYEQEGRIDDIIAATGAEETPGRPVIEVDFGDDVLETWIWSKNPNHGQNFPGTDQVDVRYKVWVRQK